MNWLTRLLGKLKSFAAKKTQEPAAKPAATTTPAPKAVPAEPDTAKAEPAGTAGTAEPAGTVAEPAKVEEPVEEPADPAINMLDSGRTAAARPEAPATEQPADKKPAKPAAVAPVDKPAAEETAAGKKVAAEPPAKPAPVKPEPAKPAAVKPEPVKPAPAKPAAAKPAKPAKPAAAEFSAADKPVKPTKPVAKPTKPVAKPAAPLAAGPIAGSTVAETVDAPAVGEEGPFGPGSAKPLPDGAAPGEEFTVKGKRSSKLFHTAESPYFGRTKADVWFKTPADAENAGFAAWNHKKKAPAK